MNIGLMDAIRDWNFEVEQEAERLIRRGVPPYDAIDQARNAVSKRRAVKVSSGE